MIKTILILFLSGAVFTDLYKDKIYNVWVIPGMLTGFIYAAGKGPGNLLNALLSIVVALLLLIPVYLIKGIAAGDVKLFLAIAPFLSMQELYSCILFSFLIAGAISIGILLIKKNKQKTMHFAVPVMASTLFVMGGVLWAG